MHLSPVELLSPASLAAMNQPVDLRPPSPSPMALDVLIIQGHVRHTLKTKASLRCIEQVTSENLNQTYLLRLSDSSKLVLTLPPPTTTGMLRHEQNSLWTQLLLHQLLEHHTILPVPRIVSYDLTHHTLGTPFILFDHIPGSRLVNLQWYLSPIQREDIDYQLGRFISSTGQVTSSHFGQLPTVATGRGSRRWREGFHELLESVLRDAEDKVIALPYQGIRHRVERWGRVLDDVREAKLVLLDLGEVIVNENTKQIEGLVRCGRAIWGDPLMAGVFEDTTTAFLDGYGGSPAAFGRERIRQLLYSAYKAIVQIVENHYRPGDELRELEARRKLTEALTVLEEMEMAIS
ncbi:MAG: hypothetical protein M1837_005204 [Sclerophora amabilis]|nr:MAG: hypothetical protein M1837_005204 [Sclerophora amabilis]